MFSGVRGSTDFHCSSMFTFKPCGFKCGLNTDSVQCEYYYSDGARVDGNSVLSKGSMKESHTENVDRDKSK